MSRIILLRSWDYSSILISAQIPRYSTIRDFYEENHHMTLLCFIIDDIPHLYQWNMSQFKFTDLPQLKSTAPDEHLPDDIANALAKITTICPTVHLQIPPLHHRGFFRVDFLHSRKSQLRLFPPSRYSSQSQNQLFEAAGSSGARPNNICCVFIGGGCTWSSMPSGRIAIQEF